MAAELIRSAGSRRPYTGTQRNSRTDFSFRIASATLSDDGNVTITKTLRRGVLRVTTSHYKAERVYAMKGERTNDDYWNYCVNEGKKVWMHNGNAYCIRPGFTYRSVRLRR
ncbi:hypothetical protein [Candidatus Solirubrobacter pratensis]|uniref:hypothetical protein n=1 Tax=Candidatus Solirubrobacter pratensis TaxID=1298857 RepID=UPI000409D73F|nr:hypothetical protein [Candidatus Solirubrobacter pratensis]